jgi:chloramphenicol 3-O-phosphotransferase
VAPSASRRHPPLRGTCLLPASLAIATSTLGPTIADQTSRHAEKQGSRPGDGTGPWCWPSPAAPGGIAIGQQGQVVVGDDFRQAEAAWITGIAAMARAGARIIYDIEVDTSHTESLDCARAIAASVV